MYSCKGTFTVWTDVFVPREKNKAHILYAMNGLGGKEGGGGGVWGWGWGRVHDQWGRNGGTLKTLCFLSFSCTDVEKKWNRWEQISGVYPSYCSLVPLWVQISAAEGDTERLRLVTTSAGNLSECVCVCVYVWGGGTGKEFANRFGISFQGERRWRCF